MLGLKVNFLNSSLIGMNVEEDFMETTAWFLNCKISNVPFIYLGILIGANPKRAETWKPMVDRIRRKLLS